MGFKFQTDQTSHTLPATRHRCNLECEPWRKAAEMGTYYSWHPKDY